ncbi:MAG: hypothetical protein KAT78_00625 [Flavobacteriaceae bacterium]|nr:hypothetical protein [Flavobacteriaceae bacterium]
MFKAITYHGINTVNDYLGIFQDLQKEHGNKIIRDVDISGRNNEDTIQIFITEYSIDIY